MKQAMLLAAAPALLGPNISDYLRRFKEHRDAVQANRERVHGNLYDADRAWAHESADRDTVLPALVAASCLAAAQQHLSAIATLLPITQVELPILGLTRACVEASARAAHVLDPQATSDIRVSRALNESLHAIAGETGDKAKEAQEALVSLATDLGIQVTQSRNGASIRYFGESERPSMTAVSNGLLERAGFPLDTLKRITRNWNGAAHGGVDSGFVTMATSGDGQGLSDLLRGNAGMAAMLAFDSSSQDLARYQGQPEMLKGP